MPDSTLADRLLEGDARVLQQTNECYWSFTLGISNIISPEWYFRLNSFAQPTTPMDV